MSITGNHPARRSDESSRKGRSVTIQRLRTDLESLYRPPFGAVATWRKIRQALDEFERHAGVAKTADMTPTAIADWLAAFPDRKPVTAFTLLSSFRRACSYAHSKGWIRSSPFQFRKLDDWLRDYDPDDDDRPRKHHSLEDLSRVLGVLAAESSNGWKEHRLFALASVTAMTGARAKEVQCALVGDFDLAERMFYVRANARRRLKTKSSKRKVPLTAECVAVLADWLPKCGSVWAFPGVRRKTPWIGGIPGTKPVDRLKDVGERCGVKGLTFLSLGRE